MREKIIRRFAAATCSICLLYALAYSAIKGLSGDAAEAATTGAVAVADAQTTQYDGTGTEETISAPDESASNSAVASQTDATQTVSAQSDSTGSSPPTLSQYLSSLRCSGCRHNCFLANPRCMRGRSKAQAATTDYYELYGD